MEYLDSSSGIRHVSEDRQRVLREGAWVWKGKTACGRTFFAEASGECIAMMIDCGSCRRILRKDGWQV